MLSNFISPGDRVELTAVDRKLEGEDKNENARYYETKIVDILSEDSIEVQMPIEQTKLILLPVDAEFNMIVYTGAGLYQCFVRVIDRYKSNNIYVLVLELTSNLRKYQRREYYRFSCALEMCSRNLVEEEVNAVANKSPLYLQPNLPIKRSVIVDISGGGLRFMSNQKYEPGSMLYISYNLLIGGERKKYELIGKVLVVKELENRPGTYEHRVQYINMERGAREEIIRFIFEEERKNLKR
ncbi:MAG: flagellar brake protein [Lachnospiraceae bacterium]|jgi:c-di-GMP-binding flagellar brake protein YcgR|nr:flagellar brake protein [Lachnospiraceae bacterium]MBO7363518.1 flagellar brake protein [Lachnospiraceae bacterium]MBO7530693.1 flagellar brake protein [Lachnospiraceae bacterium]MBP5471381.1 flagellar brake protein [Lachnospiraceae bacterium]MBP5702273.1 flagellar brake protein [Lachnospiraceae bacterium]